MHELDGAVRSYAWGSRTAIAKLRGLTAPAAHPEAELWLGAHPAAPARVRTTEGATRSLLEIVEEDPVRELGTASVERFGHRLPFLLKLLAAEEPLSLQAHPSAQQAVEGYERENALGIPLGSPVRNYRDDSHKPELVVALTKFEALAGFRRPDLTVKLLEALNVSELAPYLALLAGQPDSDGLRALFTTWITLPPQVVASLMPPVLDGCVRYLGEQPTGEFVDEARTALELSEAYPGDTGVLASLLLNRVKLEPGQGLYLDAGNLHAYLHGVGVEIMANSDNVLRGGLTPKHVDVPELLRVLDFDSVETPLREPISLSGRYEYDTPAPEFELVRFEVDRNNAADDDSSFVVESGRPRMLLCTAGSVTASTGTEALELSQGSAAWICAADPDLTITPQSDHVQVFVASTG
ncbi:MAG: mannose-6-phosphate isomerase, class I [Rhodococcus sp.]|nr:mannose-6-phosphate isomerase, class I [Rhodococcus sp. (in: high G+C Gram-positive bacteria)]